MKTKLLNFKVLAIMMACLSCALSASAYDMEIDGIYYTKLTLSTVEVSYANISTADYSGSVTIPNNVSVGIQGWTVRGIGYKAFGECRGLTSISLPGTLTYIDDLAFIRCTSLSEIQIPENVTRIGTNAFENCSSLGVVSLPSTLTSIGSVAFTDCNNISYIYSQAAEPPTLGNNVFTSTTYSNAYLLVPNSVSKEKYQAAPGWSNFSRITALSYYTFEKDGIYYCQTGPNTVAVCAKDENYNTYRGNVSIPKSVVYDYHGYTVNEVASNAFRNCPELYSVSLPETVGRIGEFAFCNCPNLTTVSFDSNIMLTEIGNNAFAGCSSLTNFTFPETLLTIGNDAFNGCSSFTSVTIPNSVTTIGASAFTSCTGLTKVTIGRGCTSIGEWGFMECTSLTQVYCFAETPPTISYYTFRNNSGFTTATLYVPYSSKEAYQQASYWRQFSNIYQLGYDFKVDNIFYRYTGDNEVGVSYEYTVYNSYTGDVNIPAQINFDGYTYNVTSLCGSAFRNCSTMTSVNLPNGIKSIGYTAFYNCSSLTSINIPETVDTIANLAFRGCTGLTRVDITNLRAWYIIAFGNPEANPLYYAERLYRNGTELTSFTEGYNTKIKNYAFYNCKSLTYVQISNTQKSIGTSAFEGCSNVTTLHITNGANNFGENVFKGCTGLTTVRTTCVTPPTIKSTTFDPSNYSNATLIVPHRSLSSFQAANYWKNFTNMDGMNDFKVNNIYYIITGENTASVWHYNYKAGTDYSGNVVIPSTVTFEGTTYTVTAIGENAFYQCPVTSVTLPSTLTKIDQGAFHYCTSLTSITIPDNVTSIGLYAFEGCTALAEVNFGNGLTSISPWAFMYCRSLTSIVLPASLTSIGGAAFAGCSTLTSITCLAVTPPTIDSSTFDASHYNHTTLFVANYQARDAYAAANYWKNFLNIISITEYDFEQDGIYYKIYYGNELGVTRIDNNGNTYSGDVVIPGTVVFNGETYTVAQINANAFYNCPNLTSVTIPATVRYMLNAFSDSQATGLASITCLAITPPTGMLEMTDGQYANVTVTVPKNSVSVYKAANGWSQFATINGMTYDFALDGLFYEIRGAGEVMVTRENSNSYSNVYEVHVPATASLAGVSYDVTAINNHAFYQCPGLQTVYLPSSVRSIGDYAFYGCPYLTSFDFADVDSIGSYSFAHCTSLATVKLYGGLESIEGTSFAECTSLKNFDHYMVHSTMTNYRFVDGVIFTNVDINKTLVCYPCGSLRTSYTVPAGTASIGAHAMRGAVALQTVILPTSLKTIEAYAFYKCAQITGVEVPKGVTTIGNYAFSGCTAMTTVILPSTLTSLGGGAFNGDQALAVIGVKATTPPVCQIVGSRPALTPFDDNHFASSMLRVPTGSKSRYQTANIWKLFNTIRESDDMVDEDILLGDVNGDGTRDVGDVTALIAYVLGNAPADFVADAANVNGDDAIDIGDVTTLISMVLGAN